MGELEVHFHVCLTSTLDEDDAANLPKQNMALNLSDLKMLQC
jgi:hypothetical protein